VRYHIKQCVTIPAHEKPLPKPIERIFIL